jgi:hypothetical protein
MDNPLFFWRNVSSSLQLKPLAEPMECLSIILIVVFGSITTRPPTYCFSMMLIARTASSGEQHSSFWGSRSKWTKPNAKPFMRTGHEGRMKGQP